MDCSIRTYIFEADESKDQTIRTAVVAPDHKSLIILWKNPSPGGLSEGVGKTEELKFNVTDDELYILTIDMSRKKLIIEVTCDSSITATLPKRVSWKLDEFPTSEDIEEMETKIRWMGWMKCMK